MAGAGCKGWHQLQSLTVGKMCGGGEAVAAEAHGGVGRLLGLAAMCC